jgi:hypothetical protein
LSGYEFYDIVAPGMRQDCPQEINKGNRSGMATGNAVEEKDADLIIVDTIIGTGPPVEKTSIVRFLYIIKTGETTVETNNTGGGPVRFAPTNTLQKLNTHSGNDPYG